VTIVANADLALQVKATLLPYLGIYTNGAAAWRAVQASGPLINEGLAPGTQVTGGLEAIFGVYPSPDFTKQYEFEGHGILGVLHYELVVIGWTAPTFPAYQALIAEFPLMTSDTARPPRLTPGSDEIVETLTVFLPVLA
jgi:hypothetical protein